MVITNKLNELLENRKTQEERFEELSQLVPKFKEGVKIFYSKDFYVRYDVETKTVYAGKSGSLYETKVNMQFPYVFYISGVYNSLEFAKFYEENEKIKADKDFSLDENGLVVLKGYGVVSETSHINSLISEYSKSEEAIVDEMIAVAEAEIKESETVEVPKKGTKKKPSKKKTTKKNSKK